MDPTGLENAITIPPIHRLHNAENTEGPGGAAQLSNHLLVTANALITVRLYKPMRQFYFAQLL